MGITCKEDVNCLWIKKRTDDDDDDDMEEVDENDECDTDQDEGDIVMNRALSVKSLFGAHIDKFHIYALCAVAIIAGFYRLLQNRQKKLIYPGLNEVEGCGYSTI